MFVGCDGEQLVFRNIAFGVFTVFVPEKADAHKAVFGRSKHVDRLRLTVYLTCCTACLIRHQIDFLMCPLSDVCDKNGGLHCRPNILV